MNNILLAVTGLSPQVITETLYALYYEGRPVHKIELITTRSGREMILKTLIDPAGPLETFIKDFGITPGSIEFSHENIHVIQDGQGKPLDDIVDTEGNEALLHLCLKKTFDLTQHPDNAVFFLIAGGRKTMSACLTAAAQFYGRQQDRIYHVLVTPEFESCRDFWYPPPEPLEIETVTPGGLACKISTSQAKIELVSMPFVSLRHMLSEDMLKTVLSPADLMSVTIREPQPELVVNMKEKKIVYGGRELDVHPGYLALYAWFAEKKKICKKKKSCRDCHECFMEISHILQDVNGLNRMYRAVNRDSTVPAISDSGITSLSVENFYSYKSKLKNMIVKAFGQTAADKLIINSMGCKPETHYGIPLDKDRISIIW